MGQRMLKKKIQAPMNQQVVISREEAEDMTEIKCEKCSGNVFQDGFKFKKVSAIMSKDGKEGYLRIPVAVCVACYTDLPPKP